MNTVEGQIAVEKFNTTEIKAEVNKGFAKIEQRHNLTPLKVLIGNAKFPAGSVVYVPGEACKAIWATKVLKIGDLEFIMMPDNYVVVVDYPRPYTDYSSGGQFTYTLDGNGGILVTGNGGHP